MKKTIEHEVAFHLNQAFHPAAYVCAHLAAKKGHCGVPKVKELGRIDRVVFGVDLDILTPFGVILRNVGGFRFYIEKSNWSDHYVTLAIPKRAQQQLQATRLFYQFHYTWNCAVYAAIEKTHEQALNSGIIDMKRLIAAIKDTPPSTPTGRQVL